MLRLSTFSVSVVSFVTTLTLFSTFACGDASAKNARKHPVKVIVSPTTNPSPAPIATATPTPTPAPTATATATPTTTRTVYFEWNSKQGYQYLGPRNAHPGGGYFNWLGGTVSSPEGTGCQDPNSFHNTVLVSDPAAANPALDTTSALKTPYSGACPNEGFTRDTTIIETPPLSEYYVRWYQKWTGSFQASTQQKFAKFGNSSDTTSRMLTAQFSMRPNNSSGTTPGALTGLAEAYVLNLDRHFDKGACTLFNGMIWITPVPIPYSDCYAGQVRGYDDSAATTAPITFNLNQWYAIEIHSKLNSSPSASDAVLEIWVDGVLKLAATNFRLMDGVTYNTPGTNNFEFQHVYYNRSNQDQSTYMDHIVISNQYNGPAGAL